MEHENIDLKNKQQEWTGSLDSKEEKFNAEKSGGRNTSLRDEMDNDSRDNKVMKNKISEPEDESGYEEKTDSF